MWHWHHFGAASWIQLQRMEILHYPLQWRWGESVDYYICRNTPSPSQGPVGHHCMLIAVALLTLTSLQGGSSRYFGMLLKPCTMQWRQGCATYVPSATHGSNWLLWQSIYNQQLEHSHWLLVEQIKCLTAEVITIENKFHINSCWKLGEELFMKTVEYINNWQYYCTLGKVQHLIIQQLFELHRLNLVQMGKWTIVNAWWHYLFIHGFRIQSPYIPCKKPPVALQSDLECYQHIQQCY